MPTSVWLAIPAICTSCVQIPILCNFMTAESLSDHYRPGPFSNDERWFRQLKKISAMGLAFFFAGAEKIIRKIAESSIISEFRRLGWKGVFIMLVIRLSRGGAKKRPFYHIVIADQRRPRNGRFVERIGFANPIAAGKAEPARINMERFAHWIGVGAQPSATVARLARAQKRAAAQNNA